MSSPQCSARSLLTPGRGVMPGSYQGIVNEGRDGHWPHTARHGGDSRGNLQEGGGGSEARQMTIGAAKGLGHQATSPMVLQLCYLQLTSDTSSNATSPTTWYVPGVHAACCGCPVACCASASDPVPCSTSTSDT